MRCAMEIGTSRLSPSPPPSAACTTSCTSRPDDEVSSDVGTYAISGPVATPSPRPGSGRRRPCPVAAGHARVVVVRADRVELPYAPMENPSTSPWTPWPGTARVSRTTRTPPSRRLSSRPTRSTAVHLRKKEASGGIYSDDVLLVDVGHGAASHRRAGGHGAHQHAYVAAGVDVVHAPRVQDALPARKRPGKIDRHEHPPGCHRPVCDSLSLQSTRSRGSL